MTSDPHLLIAAGAYFVLLGVLKVCLFNPISVWLARLKETLHLKYQNAILKILKKPSRPGLQPVRSLIALPQPENRQQL